MTLQQLRIFVHLAETGKISETARRVNLRQPTVIFHLRSLESTAGVKLFQNNRQYYRLTPAGKTLYHYAKHMVRLADEATRLMEDFHSERRAHVHLACSHLPGTYVLPRVVPRFLVKHPHASLRMDIDLGERVVAAVEKREVDLGMIMGRKIWKPGLKVIPVFEDEMGVVVSKEHPLEAIQPPLEPLDLVSTPFVMHTPASTQRSVIDLWLADHGVDLQIQLEIGSTEGIKNYIRCGQGAAFLSKMAVQEECRRGEFRFLPLVDAPTRYFQIVYPEDRWMSSVLEDLVALTVEVVRVENR